MGIGKHGMSHAEARAAADALEWSPSKTQASSRIATGSHHTSTPKQHASMEGKSATKMHHGRSTDKFKHPGGGGGHNKAYKSAHHGG